MREAKDQREFVAAEARCGRGVPDLARVEAFGDVAEYLVADAVAG